MKLRYLKYTIELKHQFSISYSSRKTTPAVLIKIEDGKYVGYGEASLPPYLKENQDSVANFLNHVELKNIETVMELNEWMNELNKEPGNYAAKAALNIAMNDLLGNKYGKSIRELYGVELNKQPVYTSYTIGIDSNEMIRQKISEETGYKILKIKLGTDRDKEIIKTIREATDKPLYVDANQAWADKNRALEMINWLNENNVLLIEQPMPVKMIEETSWLKEKSPLPVFADEAVQNFDDIDKIKNAYHGINIKLMKCGGINEALKMIEYAKKIGLKIMLGCMTETSCAIAAAVQLSPLADYHDLDGSLLISNDPFESSMFCNGKIVIPNFPGLGIKLNQNLF